MATEQIKVTTTSPLGSTSTKSISYTNPEASNEQLKTLGQKLNALTDNSYGKTDRVITINCDTEGGGGSKQTPTLTLSKTSCSIADLKDSGVFASAAYDAIATINTNSDGELFVKQSTLPFYQSVMTTIYKLSNGNTCILFCSMKDTNGQVQTVPQTVTIRADETDNYKAAEATFTITA